MISNCGSDERGNYSGGKAGDQTKKEYCVKPWYNRPWNYVLRYPDASVGEKIASISKAAANNNNIGYDQSERGTYFTQLKKVDYKPSKIQIPCEADCSSSTSANVIAAGKRMGVSSLTKINPYNTTSTIRSDFKKAGFKVLTNKKYTQSDKMLLPGDILLYEGHHVAVNLDKGENA